MSQEFQYRFKARIFSTFLLAILIKRHGRNKCIILVFMKTFWQYFVSCTSLPLQSVILPTINSHGDENTDVSHSCVHCSARSKYTLPHYDKCIRALFIITQVQHLFTSLWFTVKNLSIVPYIAQPAIKCPNLPTWLDTVYLETNKTRGLNNLAQTLEHTVTH